MLLIIIILFLKTAVFVMMMNPKSIEDLHRVFAKMIVKIIRFPYGKTFDNIKMVKHHEQYKVARKAA